MTDRFSSVGLLWHGFPRCKISGDAIRVEAAAFDGMWVGDHVLSYVDGLTALAAMAAATTKITVGTAVYLLPLRSTSLVVRALATLLLEAPGRIVFGVGLGGDVPEEYAVVDQPLAGRGVVFDSQLSDLRAAFATGEIDGERTTDLAGPCPPLWVGGRSPQAARRAALHADGMLPYLVTPVQYTKLLTEADAHRAGKPPLAHSVAVLLAVDEKGRPGRQLATAARPFNLDDELRDRFIVTGPPAACAEALLGYADAGAEHLIVNLAVPPDRKHTQMDMVAEAIIPLVRRGPSTRF